MEKKFPNAVRMYRGFLIGVKEFKEDSICLFQVFKKVFNYSFNDKEG